MSQVEQEVSLQDASLLSMMQAPRANLFAALIEPPHEFSTHWQRTFYTLFQQRQEQLLREHPEIQSAIMAATLPFAHFRDPLHHLYAQSERHRAQLSTCIVLIGAEISTRGIPLAQATETVHHTLAQFAGFKVPQPWERDDPPADDVERLLRIGLELSTPGRDTRRDQ